MMEVPMSRTHQYRKVMKPLLERKRRARINKCLEDLKDLMSSFLEEGEEALGKLEKADVLELTVKHLRDIRSRDHYGKGYSDCAREAGRYLRSVVGEPSLASNVLFHLRKEGEEASLPSDPGYVSDESSSRPSPAIDKTAVWRPF